jgi:hypothetical protein
LKLIPNPNIPQPFFVFLTDTANTGLKVFTTVEPGLPNVDLVDNTWSLEPLGILLTKEFSDFLMAAGATESVEGLQVAVARGGWYFYSLYLLLFLNLQIWWEFFRLRV